MLLRMYLAQFPCWAAVQLLLVFCQENWYNRYCSYNGACFRGQFEAR